MDFSNIIIHIIILIQLLYIIFKLDLMDDKSKK